jgi:hypothetical protein
MHQHARLCASHFVFVEQSGEFIRRDVIARHGQCAHGVANIGPGDGPLFAHQRQGGGGFGDQLAQSFNAVAGFIADLNLADDLRIVSPQFGQRQISFALVGVRGDQDDG